MNILLYSLQVNWPRVSSVYPFFMIVCGAGPSPNIHQRYPSKSYSVTWRRFRFGTQILDFLQNHVCFRDATNHNSMMSFKIMFVFGAPPNIHIKSPFQIIFVFGTPPEINQCYFQNHDLCLDAAQQKSMRSVKIMIFLDATPNKSKNSFKIMICVWTPPKINN